MTTEKHEPLPQTYAVTCRDCNGTGRNPKYGGRVCARCEGYGTVLSTSPTTDVD